MLTYCGSDHGLGTVCVGPGAMPGNVLRAREQGCAGPGIPEQNSLESQCEGHPVPWQLLLECDANNMF